ncbi:MAG: rRNA maturation RNase YbeY [Parvularculaceae bacterium]
MIEVVTGDEGWAEALPDADALAAACHRAALAFEPRLDGEIALLLCDDAEMAGLNKQFRGKDGPTNVLSFPSGEAEGFLGDMALARETCEREAAAKAVPLRDHAAHLIIHGMLHLIGYDHETETEAAAMERREVDILTALGVSDPYAGDW